MAYEIIGTILKIGMEEKFPTQNGGTFTKKKLVLIQRRFDRNTGEEFAPNYPTLEFTNAYIQRLEGFNEGDRVKVKFDVNGTKTTKEGREDYFSQLRGFEIEHYQSKFQQQQPQNHAPTGQWPQQPQQAQPQNYYPPQQPTGQQPFPPQQPYQQQFPPQDPNDKTPF